MTTGSQNSMQRNTQKQRKDDSQGKLQIKLPPSKHSSSNSLLISYELPRLKEEKVVPHRSPNYLPKLPKINLVDRIVHCGVKNRKKQKLSEREVLTNITLPEPRSSKNRYERNVRNLQPRWFRVYPVLFTHPKQEITKKVSKVSKVGNSTEDSLNLSNTPTETEDGRLNTETIKTGITFTPMDSDHIKQLSEKKCTRRGCQKIAKAFNADFAHKSVSPLDYKNQMQNCMVELVNRAAASRSNYLSTIESLSRSFKYTIPKEKRQKLLGPKEYGVNEQQFVKCVSKYVRRKKMGNYH